MRSYILHDSTTCATGNQRHMHICVFCSTFAYLKKIYFFNFADAIQPFLMVNAGFSDWCVLLFSFMIPQLILYSWIKCFYIYKVIRLHLAEWVRYSNIFKN